MADNDAARAGPTAWLFQRFGLWRAERVCFFVTGLLASASRRAAPRIAGRMVCRTRWVWTHAPANL
jgi:hypothetical protein